VPDPVAAAQELELKLGLRATSGGEHPGAGTFNRIIFIGEPYIELIGVIDRDAAQRTPVGAAVVRTLSAHPAGGLATFALVDDDLDQSVDRLRSGGGSIHPPVRGSRETASGETIAWSVATFDHLAVDRPPFLIRHELVGSEWSPDAVAQRRSYVHPSGCGVSLADVILAVGDPVGLALAYELELGLLSDRIGGECLMEVGPHTIHLAPLRRDDPDVTIVLACTGGPVNRIVDLFGVRFDLASSSEDATAATSGRRRSASRGSPRSGRR
jgi:hypothetical protein